MVIARFTLFFTTPGEIYLHAPELNSIEGELGPVYVAAGGTGSLAAMRYSFGSPVHPVLSIGDVPCPEYIEPQQSGDFGDPGWIEIGVGDLPEGVVFSGDTQRDASKITLPEDINWDLLHLRSDVGIRGTLDSIGFQCFNKDEFPAGAAELSIVVDETFWGPEVDVLRVWVEGVDIPGCVSYSGTEAFPEIQDFSPGAELLLFPWYRDGVLWANRYRIFASSDKSSQIFKDSTFRIIRKIGSDGSLKTQLSSADLVVLLDPQQNADGCYVVRVVYINRKSLADKAIAIADPQLDRLIRKFDCTPEGVLCVLQESGGKLMLQSGRKSVLFLTREGIVNDRGLLVDVDELWGTANLK
jgi:hypothetical protein